MIILVKLLLAHLLGDFLLQPHSWVLEKEKYKVKSGKLYLHLLVHALILLVIIWDVSLWPLMAGIVGCHFIIDLLKLYLQKESNKTTLFLIDQLLHLFSIVWVYFLFFKPTWTVLPYWQNAGLWILITGLFFVTIVAGIIMQVLMQKWAEEIGANDGKSLKSAGKYIGILERLFIVGFILIGHWEIIGFLLAAKSIFRFGDLKEAKDRKLTEYILIGTLLSFGIAILVGLALQKLLQGVPLL